MTSQYNNPSLIDVALSLVKQLAAVSLMLKSFCLQPTTVLEEGKMNLKRASPYQ